MGKLYYCDVCGRFTWALYDLVLENGNVIGVCRECYYSMPIDKLELENN